MPCALTWTSIHPLLQYFSIRLGLPHTTIILCLNFLFLIPHTYTYMYRYTHLQYIQITSLASWHVHVPVCIHCSLGYFLKPNGTKVMVVAVVDECHRWIAKTFFEALESSLRPHPNCSPLTNRLVEIVGLPRYTVVTAKSLEPSEWRETSIASSWRRWGIPPFSLSLYKQPRGLILPILSALRRLDHGCNKYCDQGFLIHVDTCTYL